MRGTCKAGCDVVEMDPPVYTMVITSLQEGSAMGFYCSFKCMVEDMKNLVTHAEGGGNLSNYTPEEKVIPKLIRKNNPDVVNINLNADPTSEELKAFGISPSELHVSRQAAIGFVSNCLDSVEGSEFPWILTPGTSDAKISVFSAQFPLSINYLRMQHRFRDFELQVSFVPGSVMLKYTMTGSAYGKFVTDEVSFPVDPHKPIGEVWASLGDFCDFLVSQALKREIPLVFPDSHVPDESELKSGIFKIPFWNDDVQWGYHLAQTYSWRVADAMGVKVSENLPVPGYVALEYIDEPGDIQATNVILDEANTELGPDIMAETPLEDSPALAEFEESIAVAVAETEPEETSEAEAEDETTTEPSI